MASVRRRSDEEITEGDGVSLFLMAITSVVFGVQSCLQETCDQSELCYLFAFSNSNLSGVTNMCASGAPHVFSPLAGGTRFKFLFPSSIGNIC